MSKRGKVILLILAGFVMMAIFFGGLLIYSLFSPKTPKLESESILELHLEGEMPNAGQPDEFVRLLSGQNSTTLQGVLDNIQKAKVDKRIKGLLLLVDNPAIGQGKMDDIRDAIDDFKKSGKPVYAYMERGSDREYSLAIAADKIYISPVGDLAVKGFAAHATFMRGMFDKLKIEPNFARHGKYKSAVERYTRSNMSDPDKEQLNELLDALFEHYVAVIAKSRKLSPEEVMKRIDEGPYANGVKAKEAGLVDETLYFDQVKEQIKKDLKLAKYEGISSTKYSNMSGSEVGLGKGEKFALIYATGAIVSGKSNQSPFSDQNAGSDTIAAAIKKAREDKNIKAIILRVDSPGGSALASDIIWHEVMLTKAAKKPIIACMSDVAASGGYYISMATDKIIAQPGTITGSIGVFSGKLNIGGLYREHLGLNTEAIIRGKNADIYSEFSNFSEEQLAKIEKDMDSFYQTFISKVAAGRGLKVEDVDAIGQGRVWSGVQGKKHGLVDELGGMSKAIEVAKKLANLPADSSPQLVEFPKPPNFAQIFLGNTDEDEAETRIKEAQLRRTIEAEMPAEMRETMRYFSMFKHLENEPFWALLPYQISFQ